MDEFFRSPGYVIGVSIPFGIAYALKVLFLWGRMFKERASFFGRPLRSFAMMFISLFLVWLPFVEEDMGLGVRRFQWVLTIALWLMLLALIPLLMRVYYDMNS